MVKPFSLKLPFANYFKTVKRPLLLSASLVLLSLSVLFMADLAGLKFSTHGASIESRKAVVEALAVQLSTLAEHDKLEEAQSTVSRVVLRNDDIFSASLVRSTGVVLASVGETGFLANGRFLPGSSQLKIPLYADGDSWGELRVVFEPLIDRSRQLIAAFVIGLGLLLSFTAFLYRALVQLDPKKAVPGRVDSAMDLFSAGVIVLDRHLRIVMVNQSAEQLVARKSGDLLGYHLDDWPWQKEEGWEAPWNSTLSTGISVSDHPMSLVTGDKSNRSLLISCVHVGEKDGDYNGVLVTLDDITTVESQNKELTRMVARLRESQDLIKDKNEELRKLASTDALSGVANRRALMESLEGHVIRAREEGSELSCIMTDIDFFKKVNDTYGHKVGDDVIKACADVLSGLCGEGDVVGRYGGEEFVMVLPGRNAVAAAKVAERARIAVIALAYGDALPLDKLSSSFGVADLSCGAEDGASLVDVADQCLYLAKERGRDCVVTYEPDEMASITESSELSINSDQAKSRKEFDHIQARVVELETQVEKREQELCRLGEYDALTGMPLRAVFLQRTEVELSRAANNETFVGVISFEFRDVESILENFGYSKHDELIKAVLARLQLALRDTDIVSMLSTEHSLSRITSNEYAILVSSLHDMTSAMIVVTRMKRALTEPFTVADQKIYMGAAIGIAVSSDLSIQADNLLSDANRARSIALVKTDKFAHEFSERRLSNDSHDYFQLEADLHDALQSDSIETWYQPKYDLAENCIVGMEALLRWNHPTRGFVSPDLFVAIAEANGLIDVLSRRVLSATLQQIQIWRSMGFDDLRVSINISPLQLRAETLVQDTLKELEAAGVEGSKLEIELTETSVLENPEQAKNDLSLLREAGVRVSLDDFGTGYTSLTLLSELPLDVVKIDRSFVDPVDKSERSRAMVGSVINMAHSLGLKVVGEGVETTEQLEVLRHLACDEVQGYLISRPAPADEITAFLVKESCRKKSA